MRIDSLLKRHVLAVAIAALAFASARAGTFETGSTAAVERKKAEVLAAQFLSRTTFGPKMPEIQSLADRIEQIGSNAAFEEWIDSQFNLTPTKHWDTADQMMRDAGWGAFLDLPWDDSNGQDGNVDNHNRYRAYAWWENAVHAEDQLRQRVAWALIQIFVVGENGDNEFRDSSLDIGNRPKFIALADYYDDVCVMNAFTDYRTLIEDMVYHPVMTRYLTSRRSRKPNPNNGTLPDENLIRELFQLFSIGVVLLEKDGTIILDGDGNAIDTYSNDDIRAFARVLTGFVDDNLQTGTSFSNSNANRNLHDRSEIHVNEHDFDEKTGFNGDYAGVSIPALTIPAREATSANADADVDDLLDYLAYDHPNTSPFICRLLIQRLVKSNPSKRYIQRVTRVFDSSQGDMKELIKAIYLDREAIRSLRLVRLTTPPGLQVRNRGTEATRLREPVLRYTAIHRAFNAASDAGSVGAPDYLWIYNQAGNIEDFNQAPYESPSVFNFYPPDHQPPLLGEANASKNIPNGQLYMPEEKITTAVQSNLFANEMRELLVDSDLDTNVRIRVGGLGGSSENRNVDVDLDFSPFYDGMLGPNGVEPTAAQVKELIDWMDLVLCHGVLGDPVKQSILDACMTEINDFNISSNSAGGSKENLVRGVVYAVVLSPDCAVSD